MTVEEVLAHLESKSSEKGKKSSAHFGVTIETLGVRMPDIRELAKNIKRNHALALQLWTTKVHEARLLATLVADPKEFTSELFDLWTADFRSWDLCDQACINLFIKTPFVDQKIAEYALREEEYIKRTAFSLIAVSAVHRKKERDEIFLTFLALIKVASSDPRNFVKKAVNWALRQIGKRNALLHTAALNCAEEIAQQTEASAKWIAADAIRELNSEKIKDRIKGK